MVTYINVIISHTTMEETPTNNTDVEEVDSPVCVCCISYNFIINIFLSFQFSGATSDVCCPYLHLRGNHLWQLHQGSLLSPQEDLHHHQILHKSKGRNRCPAAILMRRYSPKFLSWHLSGMKQAPLESMWELDCGVLLQGKGLWHPLK